MRLPPFWKISPQAFLFISHQFYFFERPAEEVGDIIDEHSTIEVAYNDWINKLMEIIDSHIPKTKLRDINTPPWINGPVMHLVRKKNEARKKL